MTSCGVARRPPALPAIRPRTSATFLVVGDIMLARRVAAAMSRARDPLLPFSGMRDVLHSVAFAFGNLESPFSARAQASPSANRLIFGAPSDTLSGLMDAGFKILNLANNHALDQGPAGLRRTARLLDENAIQHVGAGSDLDQAWQPAIVTANGIRIAFVGASYASLNDLGVARSPLVARIEDRARLRRALAGLRARADFVVVTMHAGNEYTHRPNQAQIDFAHAAIDAGANLVVGAHSHWVQTFESYNGKPVFYGLGNFIFDQDWSRETTHGLALRVRLAKLPGAASASLERIELLPVIIEQASTPRLTTESEGRTILQDAGLDGLGEMIGGRRKRGTNAGQSAMAVSNATGSNDDQR
jgi:poly-gamma-glutamate synthesis protein (capsule biosynthesis protein)